MKLIIEKHPKTFDTCKLADLPTLIEKKKKTENQELHGKVIDYLRKKKTSARQ